MSAIPITIYAEEGVESEEDLQGFPVAGDSVRSALHCTRRFAQDRFVTQLFADVTMPARETLTLASGHAVRCGQAVLSFVGQVVHAASGKNQRFRRRRH